MDPVFLTHPPAAGPLGGFPFDCCERCCAHRCANTRHVFLIFNHCVIASVRAGPLGLLLTHVLRGALRTGGWPRISQAPGFVPLLSPDPVRSAAAPSSAEGTMPGAAVPSSALQTREGKRVLLLPLTLHPAPPVKRPFTKPFSRGAPGGNAVSHGALKDTPSSFCR